jgi:ADP-ribosylglycohydrolase
MLGLAAGDTAGGAWEPGYSAVTEQATVVAYQLIEHGRLQPSLLVKAIRELDGSGEEEPVYRAESAHIRAWLDRASRGSPEPEPDPSLDGAPRAVPLGVALRRRPELLRTEAVVLGELFHADPSSIVAGVVAAGAVAASCFGQSGRDLIAGVIEMMEPALEMVGQQRGESKAGDLVNELAALRAHVGVIDGPQALSLSAENAAPTPWDRVKAGLLLSAPIVDRAHVPVEQAAKIGGSAIAAMVGGIVGARVGIRAWPWAFANDTWFAEIGRRLVRGPQEVGDLPIPYAVEHHLISSERHGL